MNIYSIVDYSAGLILSTGKKQLLKGKTEEWVAAGQKGIQEGTLHPMTIKKEIAYDIVAQLYPESDAQAAQLAWQKNFQEKSTEYAQPCALLHTIHSPITLLDLVKACLPPTDTISNTECRRLIAAGAVKIDGTAIADPKTMVELKRDMVVKIGKQKLFKIE